MNILYLFDSTLSKIIWPPYHNTLDATQIPTNIDTLFFCVLTQKLKEPASLKKKKLEQKHNKQSQSTDREKLKAQTNHPTLQLQRNICMSMHVATGSS
jgi:hypothetical protein